MTKQPNYTKNEVSLKEYVDTRLLATNDAMRIRDVATAEALNVRIVAIQESIKLAHSGMEKRLDGMNEFRSQLKDQAATFLSRDEYALMHDKVLEDIRDLRESRAELSGKASQNAVIGSYVLAVLGLIVSVVSMVGHLVK